MHPSRRYHRHLRILLNDPHGVITTDAAADPFTEAFLETLADERIHIHRSDWQGRPVIALVWHYPDRMAAIVTLWK